MVYYYARPDNSTFRYRVFNMIEALRIAEPAAAATWITEADGDRALDIVASADLLVICRALYGPRVASLVVRARSRGIPILFFDVDDLIFDDRYTHLIMETLDQPVEEDGLDFWFGHVARIGSSLRLCDGVITTNEYLAERIQGFTDLPTQVVPNFLNSAHLDVSRRLLDAKRVSRLGARRGDSHRLLQRHADP